MQVVGYLDAKSQKFIHNNVDRKSMQSSYAKYSKVRDKDRRHLDKWPSENLST